MMDQRRVSSYADWADNRMYQLAKERDEALEAEKNAHKVNEMMAQTCNNMIADRDEARNLAREILEWFDGEAMRPDWEAKHPWIRKMKL